MRAIVLCAGYATRLYPLTADKPKHLLPIAGRPMLDFLIRKIEAVGEICTIYIVTNQKFFDKFKEWKDYYEKKEDEKKGRVEKIKKEIKILNDGTFSEDTKLGAIGDIHFTLEKEKISDDVLVVAGDNIFEFDLVKFVDFFMEKKAPCVAVRDVGSFELVKKYSEVSVDGQGKITYFKEKPKNPHSTLSAICLYAFPSHTLYLIRKYIDEGNDPDNAGSYIEWLYKKLDVFAFSFSGVWYDIGDLEEYRKANDYFSGL